MDELVETVTWKTGAVQECGVGAAFGGVFDRNQLYGRSRHIGVVGDDRLPAATLKLTRRRKPAVHRIFTATGVAARDLGVGGEIVAEVRARARRRRRWWSCIHARRIGIRR